MPTVHYQSKKGHIEKNMQEYKDKKEKLSKEIENIANNYTENPENLAELAIFSARFYKYSFRNTLLIFSQNPFASFVGSFAKFKEIGNNIAAENNLKDERGQMQYLGVKAGAKSMYVFAPTPITYLLIDGEYIKLSTATKEQKSLYEAGEIKAMQQQAYKLVPVFDISQTLIPPEYYPKIFSVGKNNKQAAEIYDKLKNYIEIGLNCPVEENIDNSISLRGLCYTTPETAGININSKLKDTMRLSTLSHEVGHFLMHRDTVMPEKSVAQKEVEADIMSIMLLSYFGQEVSDVRKAHLADNYRAYAAALQKNSKPFDSINTIFSNASNVFEEFVVGFENYMHNMEDIAEDETEDESPGFVQSM